MSARFSALDGGKETKMARKTSHPLSELPCRDDDGNLQVVIETPRKSPNKYRYDPECGTLLLSSMLPEGMSFPYDFGFIPSTEGGDGDPLDVLVLMDEPAIPLAIVRTRLIGAIEAEQKDGDSGWETNTRLIGVATHAHSHADETSLKSLRPHLVEEIIAFFEQYNRQRGSEFRCTGLCGPRKAARLVEAGERQFRKNRKK